MSLTLSPLVSHPVASLADARERRARRRRLRDELDAYRTPAERAELDAIMSRHTAEEHELLAQMVGRTPAA